MAIQTAELEVKVSRETYAALLLDGETAEDALQRLEGTPDYAKVIGSDAGQALLAAATQQVESIPNGGVKRKDKRSKGDVVVELLDGTPVAEPFIPPDAASATVAAFQAKVSELAPGVDSIDTLTLVTIPIAKVEVASNVREDLGDLEELAASIREHGVLSPILVTVVNRGLDDEAYRVLAGHRRLAASVVAGRSTIPALVDLRAELGDDNSRRAIVQVVENVQRTDLNAIDLAKAIKGILDARKDLKHGDVAKWIGKDRTWVTNALRLLETAPEIQEAVVAGTLTATHARAIAAVDLDLQTSLLETVIEGGLSAKATEIQAQHVKDSAKRIRERQTGIDKRAAEAIAMLEKVANRATATIAVEDYYTGDGVKRALDEAGWRVTNGGGVQVIAESGSCGCAGVWRLAIPYNDAGHVTLHPACNSSTHAAARKAALDDKWKADQAKANETRRAEREAAEAGAARVRSAVVDILAEQPPTPLARRLTLYALLEGEVDDVLADEYVPDQAEREKLFDDDDAPWAMLAAIPDEDLAGVHARAIVDFVGGYSAGPGIQAAIEAWMDANGRTEVILHPTEALVWRALRKSPNGGYTPGHLFSPALSGTHPKTDPRVVAACGFDPFDSAKNGYFDTVMDPAKTPGLKAIQKRCRKCETAGQPTLEAVVDVGAEDEDLRPTGDVNVDALRGEAERSVVDEAD